jgi:hypothetical protein
VGCSLLLLLLLLSCCCLDLTLLMPVCGWSSPQKVYVVLEDASHNRLCEANGLKPGRLLLEHLGDELHGDESYFTERHITVLPWARCGWQRGPDRGGTHDDEKVTAIVTLRDASLVDELKRAQADNKLPGLRLVFDLILNNDAFKNTDAFVLHNIVATGTEASKVATQAQVRTRRIPSSALVLCARSRLSCALACAHVCVNAIARW